jgi:hypothetical protein
VTQAETITVHDLKCWSEPFEAVRKGYKTAEFRRDDRGFTEGDYLRLWEFRKWHGVMRVVARVAVNRVEPIVVAVTHIVRGPEFGIPGGYVMMSITKVDAEWAGIDTSVEHAPPE